ncbi:hypothetical protein [Fodinibius halophilus]|uniref:Uncharacterized protein n=1 Tax=Fodinibius halophilus TaxID=1736908 RepID=A0A6M1T7L6_9BACT|nr:hypothetical protein [Fodinibius halophilus]NGP87981.1 hypothetical protein [Fodinibius halophilus]
MGNKKSLGSSPIGLGTGSSSKMDFIPDLGVSDGKSKEKDAKKKQAQSNNGIPRRESESLSPPSPTKKKPKKKVVSYNLEVSVIEKVKTMAEEQEMYYSGLVNKALKSWLAD